MMKKRRVCIYVSVIVCLLLSSCNLNGNEVKPLSIGNKSMTQQDDADEAKHIVLSMEEVNQVVGVSENKNIYLAVKVGQFNRLFLRRIRKDAHDKVKKRFPDANVHVSTDKKVFMELEKLEKKLYKDKVDQKELKKELKRIEDFMKG